MPLKPTIFYNVPRLEIHSRVVHEFKLVIDSKKLNEDTYTLVFYPGMRGKSTSIVDSKSISKAISKTSEHNQTIVTVAHAFTSEAFEVLEKEKAVHFYKSSFYWSDESLRNIRVK